MLKMYQEIKIPDCHSLTSQWVDLADQTLLAKMNCFIWSLVFPFGSFSWGLYNVLQCDGTSRIGL